MTYFVTCDETGGRDRAHCSFRGLTLNRACVLAFDLIAEGAQNVAIGDTRGRKIGGDDLASCREGTRLVTFGLKAIEIG
ncbi:MAG TPA: hypothetical protein VMF58_18885 [Rhizomicrobium sp.]|nr:hypothetical protein [Rhizomicrobium sp.]